ncbi:hypothetical protein SAMN05192553_101819 [Cyclobacterium xiamenense]|uniref:Uncharacterized protein n=1 Tax=Cyclobacterium xiamenense TaxID=1297121 RepID=A0A1H6UFZ2_9BACT|nr:hypothetical protein [Cyclobacterium xiamenense]SEI91323.1 hypothetical protein SAMN05192553_101819 [Cyclobacterium xiamenense]
MNKFPKESIFKTPENYFDSLPDRILRKRKQRIRQLYLTGVAAAVVFVVGFAFVLVPRVESDATNFQTAINEEVDYYITAGTWDEVDVLLLADNPNELLDAITAAEWRSELGAEDEELLLNEILF